MSGAVPQPYEGLVVYDATQGVAGPHCTLLLALHGATVIKVEPPEGDWLRRVGNRHGDHSAHSLAYNRGKRSVVLDLRTPEGRDAAKRLAARADVVVENFRPGTMARLGLDYATLSATRPELVYCSISGFGQSGPYSGDAAVDTVIQAFSGWMHANRDERGVPQVMDVVAIDILTGLYAFQAVSARLAQRFRYGRGGYDDVSMLQSTIAFLAPKVIDEAMPVANPTVLFSAPNGRFATRDGAFIVSVTRQEHFFAVCRALARPDLERDARFSSREARVANGPALMALMREEMSRHDNAALHAAFRREGALGAPVQDFARLLSDPHVLATQALEPLPRASVPGLALPRIPGTPGLADGAGDDVPRLGEHTREVLAESGFTASEIEALGARP